MPGAEVRRQPPVFTGPNYSCPSVDLTLKDTWKVALYSLTLKAQSSVYQGLRDGLVGKALGKHEDLSLDSKKEGRGKL